MLPKTGVPRVLRTDNATPRVETMLGVTKEQLDATPSISALVKRGAGSISEAVEALRSDDSPDARAFLAKWELVPASKRSQIRLEAYILAAGLTTRRFIEVLTGALLEHSTSVAKMVVAAAQPRVLESVVKAATDEQPIFAKDPMSGERIVIGRTNGDVKAQELFLKGTGFLPTPKGSSTTINLQQTNQTANFDPPQQEAALPPPAMDAFLLELQDINRPKALPSKSVMDTEHVPVIGSVPEAEYLDAEV